MSLSDEIRARHHLGYRLGLPPREIWARLPEHGSDPLPVEKCCAECDKPWPCDAIRAADELDRLTCWACRHPLHEPDICPQCEWVCIHGDKSVAEHRREGKE